MDLLDAIEPVLALVRTAPAAAAVTAYRQAARDFFTNTRAWRETLAELDVTGGTSTVTLTPTAGEVFDVSTVYYQTSKLHKRTRVQMMREAGAGATATAPFMYRLIVPNTLQLYPTPTADATAALKEVRVMIRPTLTDTAIPDEVIGEFGDLLNYGATAYLLRQPSQEWTDYKGAAVYNELFEEAKDMWRSKAADDGMVNVPRTVAYGGIV